MAREETTEPTGAARHSNEPSRAPDPLLRAFVEAMPLVAFVKDVGGRYIYLTAQLEKQTSLTAAALIGKTDEQVFSREIASRRESSDRQALAGEVVRTLDTFPSPDGGVREWSCVKFPIETASGGRFIGAVLTDVTEQRRAQRAVAESQMRLKAALEAGFDAFYLLDAVRDDKNEVVDFVFVDVNRNGELLLAKPRWDLIKHCLSEVLPPDRKTLFMDRYIRALETRTPLEEEFHLEGTSGMRWFRQQVVPLGDGIAITSREITEQKHAEALTQEHTRVLENALGGIAFVTNEGRFAFANAEFCKMLATNPEELANQPWQAAVELEDVSKVAAALDRIEPNARIETEFRGARRDGLPVEMRCVIIPVVRESSFVGHYVFAMDITEQRRYERMLEEANSRLRELAATDSLTGLKNRREFQARLLEEVSYAHRYHQPLALVMADVDHFKQFNDAFGHPAGDTALRQVARVLLQEARIVDVVARYGGEEFALILPGTDLDGAVALAERCRKAIEEEHWPLRAVTASFGCADFATDRDSVESLTDAADRALYASKGAGRNKVTRAS